MHNHACHHFQTRTCHLYNHSDKPCRQHLKAGGKHPLESPKEASTLPMPPHPGCEGHPCPRAAVAQSPRSRLIGLPRRNPRCSAAGQRLLDHQSAGRGEGHYAKTGMIHVKYQLMAQASYVMPIRRSKGRAVANGRNKYQPSALSGFRNKTVK